MNKLWLIIVILQLMLGGYCCGRSDEKSPIEKKVKGEVKSLEKKVGGEEKHIEEDMGMLEENPKKLGEEVGKEEEEVPPPQEDWGDEPESMDE